MANFVDDLQSLLFVVHEEKIYMFSIMIGS